MTTQFFSFSFFRGDKMRVQVLNPKCFMLLFVTVLLTYGAQGISYGQVCEAGDILAPGESCTYPGTDAEFSVLNNGNGQFLFFSSGNSLNIENTVINGQSYTLVANKLTSGSWEIEAIADSTVPVTTNTAPTFTEDASTTRSVAENTSANVNIGNAVAATDPENDTLTYTLSGTDAPSFDIDSTTGQLKTKSALDYETKSTYTVTVTVSDGSLADTIAVTINVTNIAETSTATTAINIPDSNLRAKIETALGKASGDPISAAEMETLTSLTAQDASISNLTGLETATNLTTLKLGNNSISDISALTGLTLTELQLWDNSISNISAVAGLTQLTRLYLWGNTITDISHVAGLTNLTHLRLGENSISNISAVAGLTNLTHLNVRENSVSNISAVAGLTNLTELVIGNNTISDIAPVANLTKLVWLDMPNNSITDISAVTGLTNLIELYFEENSVSDLTPLVTNTGLGTNTEIDVRGNPLNYPSIYTHIPTLQARGAFVDFDNRVATAPVKISGDTQQGSSGTTLAQPFVVEVRDGDSTAFAEVPVTFAVTAGGGTLSVTSTTTDANGRAESTLTLGNTAGTNTVRVSVQGISQAAIFTAVATTTNTAPTFTEGTNTTRTIAENTATGVNIGTAIAATDADNDSLTYTLSGTDAAAFNIDSTTGQLKTRAALDYETKSTYTVTITVSDGNLTDTITVTINVTDVAETPANTGVCEVGDILAPGESCTYPSTDAEFAVHNNGNGQFLFFSSGNSLNIKNTVINGQSYTLVADKLASGSWKIEEIADSAAPATTNTAPTFTEGASTTRTIAENTSTNVNIGAAVAATDSDNDTLTYTLSGTDSASFSINSSTGQLQTKSALDYETKSAYTVAIAVTDGSLTDTITVTITVTNVHELATSIGACEVGDVLAPGESCTYPGTDATFSVLDNGQAQWNIPDLPALLEWINQTSISGSLSISTTINGETYHFVAEELSSGSWEIKEIGDSGTQQPTPPEQPEQPETESDPPTLSASTAAPLTEATLHEGVVTLTLSDGTYEQSSFSIRNAITLSGIDGVTVGTFGVDRVSDTEATVELEFNGNISTDSTLTFTVESGAIADYDGGALTAQIPVTAVTESLAASTTDPLTEATLDESVITLTLNGRFYEQSSFSIRDAVTVSGINGVTVGTFDVDRVSDTQVTVELTFSGDFDTDATLTITVEAGAIAGYDGAAFTAQISVTAGTESLAASTVAPLTEATLDESVVTLTLTGGIYEQSRFTIRNAITLSGVSGVTIGTFGVSRISDTEITVELVFNGNIDTDSTLTFTLAASAIANYDGSAFTAQIPVTAGTESLVASTETPLTEATLDENVITLTLTGRTYEQSSFSIRDAVTLSGIDGVTVGTFDVDRVSDTQVTVELTFDGTDFDTDATLTITVEAGAIVGYDGSAFTAQIPVTAGMESLVASTAVPLTESTLDESIVMLTLNGGIYERSSFRIRDAVMLSGIAGVTVGTFGIDRVSDTEITVELEFDGNFQTDTYLTFTVDAEAIAGYNGPALTAEVPVTAGIEADANNDGVVSIDDLVLVASNYGKTGQNTADVNGDGVVNVDDLLTVTGALDNAAAAPVAQSQALEMFTAADIKLWLSHAQRLDLTDATSLRGILFLERLLAALLPKETVLLANYPNPFNPETWIPYRLAEDAFVTLTIYDGSGQVIRTLDVGYQSAAFYETRSKAIYWDGRNEFGEGVASGVYFYHLSAGDFSATRKMLIIK